MDRALGLVALLLALSAPTWCRKLVDFDHSPTAATTHNRTDVLLDPAGATQHELKQFALLPTPNVASPVLQSLVVASAPRPASDLGPQRKRHRKPGAREEEQLWSALPGMKHLVEIVPIKHGSAGTRGNALAYIVPQSHKLNKKLNKRKKISGIVLDRQMYDSTEDFQSSEKSSNARSSESGWSESGSDSVSEESREQEVTALKDDHFDNAEVGITPENTISDDDISTSKDKINNKLNDIVSYFKEHGDSNSLIHDVMPDPVDPEYQVHYIIHKKHRALVRNDSSEDRKHHHRNSVRKTHKVIENDNDKHEQLHVYSQSDDLGIVNHQEDHSPVKVKDKAGNSEGKLIQLSHNIDEHYVAPYHNELQIDLEQSHAAPLTPDHHTPPHHTHSSEHFEYMTGDGEDASIPIESMEQLHDLIHEGAVDPDLNQIYELLAQIENDSRPDIQINPEEAQAGHQLHVYDYNISQNNDQSDDFESNWDDFSSNKNRETLNNEEISDESQSADDTEDTKTQYLVDSSNLSNSSPESEYSSQEDLSNQVQRSESEQNNLLEPSISTAEDIHTRGPVVIDAASQESASIEIQPNISVQHNNGTELAPKDHAGHDILFPNCMKLNKKSPRKCENGCAAHKTYTLTFLFNN